LHYSILAIFNKLPGKPLTALPLQHALLFFMTPSIFSILKPSNMEPISKPDIYCPFPPAINPLVEEAQLLTINWMQRFSLVTDQASLERYSRAKPAWLAARTLPTAGLSELSAATDFNTWLFILDDQYFDETTLGRQAHYIQQLTTTLIKGMENNRHITLKEGLPIEAALSDVWRRLRQMSTLQWQARFVQRVKEYLQGCVWEAENREHQRVPSLAAYMATRPYSSAVYTCIAMIEPAEKVYLPNTVLQHERVQRMTLLANEISCWANDLFSYEKEQQHGDVHNLVTVLQHEFDLDLQQALSATVRIHDTAVKLFLELEKCLPTFDPATDEQLMRYVSLLKCWVRSNLDWSLLDTQRYGTSTTLPCT
jgi:hypothetical protein